MCYGRAGSTPRTQVPLPLTLRDVKLRLQLGYYRRPLAIAHDLEVRGRGRTGMQRGDVPAGDSAERTQTLVAHRSPVADHRRRQGGPVRPRACGAPSSAGYEGRHHVGGACMLARTRACTTCRLHFQLAGVWDVGQGGCPRTNTLTHPPKPLPTQLNLPGEVGSGQEDWPISAAGATLPTTAAAAHAASAGAGPSLRDLPPGPHRRGTEPDDAGDATPSQRLPAFAMGLREEQGWQLQSPATRRSSRQRRPQRWADDELDGDDVAGSGGAAPPSGTGRRRGTPASARPQRPTRAAARTTTYVDDWDSGTEHDPAAGWQSSDGSDDGGCAGPSGGRRGRSKRRRHA